MRLFDKPCRRNLTAYILQVIVLGKRRVGLQDVNIIGGTIILL